MLNVFRKRSSHSDISWALSANHPTLDLDDADPLPACFGEAASLPPEMQAPVSTRFICGLQDTMPDRRVGALRWFNAKLSAAARLDSFGAANEAVWVYVRFREVLFSTLYTAFVHGVEHLNGNRMVELMPRLAASGWKQAEIENVLIVLLDHGNNQEVRMLGWHVLCLYVAAAGGRGCSKTAADLFTNGISLRAFSYVDKPDASRIVGDIMCAVASGVEVTDIGCGQRAIVGFKTGRSSICPVLQDTAFPINPQGILAMRMVRSALLLAVRLAGLASDPRVVCTRHADTSILTDAVQGTSTVFGRGIVDGTYTNRMPLLGLQVIVNFMLEHLTPQSAHMVSERDFYMPFIGQRPDNEACSRNPGARGASEAGASAPEETEDARVYTTLRRAILDHGPKYKLFFVDVLRLSLGALSKLAADGPDADSIDRDELAQAGFEVCVGALTVIRLWLVSRDEYRPAHLQASDGSGGVSVTAVMNYVGYVHQLMDWLVEENRWDTKKLVLLYNGLLIHRIAMRAYRNQLPRESVQSIMDGLQQITLKLLSKPSTNLLDESNPSSYPNRALALLADCLAAGWLLVGAPIATLTERFRAIYMATTVWTSHLATWRNVLVALTAAGIRHVLFVDERVLIQESMFSGQRQRRGMNRVDEYMANLKDPMYYMHDPSPVSSFDASTPLCITSSLTWDTMRMVFTYMTTAAKKEADFKRACAEQCRSTESRLADPGVDNHPRSLLQSTRSIYASIFIGASAQSAAAGSVRAAVDSTHHAPVGPAHLVADSEGGSNRSAAVSLLGEINTSAWQREAMWIDFHISDYALAQGDRVRSLRCMWHMWVGLLGSPVDADDVRAKFILRGLVQSWDVYRAGLDCSRCAPDDDFVVFRVSHWIAEIAAKFGVDDYRGRVAQTALFRMGCRFSERVSERILFLRARFLQKGEPVNAGQVHMFLVECRMLLSFGIPGSRMLLLALERGLRRMFLDSDSCSSGSLPDAAVQGAVTLLVSMGTLLANSRVLNARKGRPNVRRFSDSSLISAAEDEALIAHIGYVEKDQYPILDKPQGSALFHVRWEDGGPVLGKVCDVMWQLAFKLSSTDAFSYRCRRAAEGAVLSGMTVVCLSELAMPKSIQNARLIDNCIAAVVSRLFATQHDILRMAVSNLSAFVIGRAGLAHLLGVERARKLAMYTMMAIVEQLDRATTEFTVDSALSVRELMKLLLDILVKEPETIIDKSPHEYAISGQRVRDFLVEHVVQRCAHPTAPAATAPHEYNRGLGRVDSESGVVLRLEPADYTYHESMGLDEFVLLSEDGGKPCAENQMGEAFYMALMVQFDEDARSRVLGRDVRTPSNSYADSSSSASGNDNTFYYLHGNTAGSSTGDDSNCAPDMQHSTFKVPVCEGEVFSDAAIKMTIPVISSLSRKRPLSPIASSDDADQPPEAQATAQLQAEIDAFLEEEARASAGDGNANANHSNYGDEDDDDDDGRRHGGNRGARDSGDNAPSNADGRRYTVSSDG
ncbi:hypothetical protein H4R18_005456 [Coemansia javaensis]|uniref:Uncharacterized protein n=1 Tax=Coemansia javaensis TaxID=2761396 RepID=A0A9W8H1U4_9FUNG|nr:hypothetical protein H4R18_005456 [Coemansia javaensis]